MKALLQLFFYDEIYSCEEIEIPNGRYHEKGLAEREGVLRNAMAEMENVYVRKLQRVDGWQLFIHIESKGNDLEFSDHEWNKFERDIAQKKRNQ